MVWVMTPKLDDDKVVFEMELEGVRESMANLLSYPFVKEAVETGRLKLQGAYFSIIQARLMMSNDKNEFELIEA